MSDRSFDKILEILMCLMDPLINIRDINVFDRSFDEILEILMFLMDPLIKYQRY